MHRYITTSIQVILSIILIVLMLIFVTACFGIGVAGGFMLGCWEDVVALDLNSLEYQKDRQTWRQNLEIYSSICMVQLKDTADFVIDKLRRIEYEDTTVTGKGANSQGEYSLKLNGEKEKQNGTIQIFTREFTYPSKENETVARRISLNIYKGKIESIRDNKGNSIRYFYLEPELIAEPTEDDRKIKRKIIPRSEMPNKLIDAFIAIEDRRFYQHAGIDIIRLFGAIKDSFIGGQEIEGTSTLTQQLTRNIYLGRERTPARKTREILLAFRIEKQLSKSQILEAYLNFIDFGFFRGQQLFGVQKAAMAYFGKEVSELEFHECALLASIPKGTTLYSPDKNPQNAKKRRNVVLRSMYNLGYITFQEYEYSRNQPLEILNPTKSPVKEREYTAGHFISHIRSELEKIPQLKGRLHNEGLKVYTTIDMSMQSVAMDSVADHLRKLDHDFGKHLPDYDTNKFNKHGLDPIQHYLQAALIAFEPKTGHVKAMVGGRDYHIAGQKINFLNRTVGKSLRQPGSAFKPIVFSALMQDPPLITPATIIIDEPWGIEHVPGQYWAPSNYIEGRHYGPLTVRKILAKSINVPTARAAWDTPETEDGYQEGIVRIINLAKKMGIATPMNPAVPSLTLGAYGMTVLELTSAYGIFANRGIKVEPNYIEYVTDENGESIYPPRNYQPDRTRVLDEKVAYMITSFLQSVFKAGGTAVRARSNPAFHNWDVAGKTGTTNKDVDAWFIGYSTDLVVGVWVGLDKQGRKLRNYNQQGAWAALPIWIRFMAEAVRGPKKPFPVPEGIVFWEIDTTTGLLRNKDKCPEENISNEPFIIGQEPTKICDQH